MQQGKTIKREKRVENPGNLIAFVGSFEDDGQAVYGEICDELLNLPSLDAPQETRTVRCTRLIQEHL